MSNKSMFKILLILVLFSIIISACGGTATEAPAPVETEPPVVETEAPAAGPTEMNMAAILTVGLDNAWDRTFVESFERVQAEKPHGLTISDLDYTEGVWADQAEPILRGYAESGKYDIIWAHSTYSDQVKNLAKEFPEIAWVVVGSGNEGLGGNVYWVYKRIHEPSYLMGILAGCSTESNVIGAVGTFAFDDVNDEINAFFEGAKSVNPDIVQKVSFIESWYDPAKAYEAAKAQIAAGEDHLFMIAESFEPCTENNILCYGPYMDYNFAAPENVLTSPLAFWDPDIKWVIDGWYNHKTTGDPFAAPADKHWFSMRDGASGLADFHGVDAKIPQECMDKYDQAYKDFMDGKLDVPLNIEVPLSTP
jgi:basic membrane lipoprotein Med (substrate-binding protein (PBP1-ABC) superfamily)